MDEVRIAAVARSASWIAADYASQNAPGTFIQPPAGQGPLSTLASYTTYSDMSFSGAGQTVYFAF